MEHEEPQGGAVGPKVLQLNSSGDKETEAETETAPCSKPDPVSGLVQSPVSAPAEDHNPDQNHAPGRVQTKDPVPDQNHNPSPVRPPAPGPVQSPAPVQVPVQTPGPVKTLIVRGNAALALLKALVQSSGQTQVRAAPVRTPGQTEGPGPVQVSVSAQTKTLVPGPLQTPAPVQSLVQSPASVPAPAKASVLSPVPPADPGSDLVPVSIPPEAVRALSPPPTTTPLKPSVPPLGFRLNGRLIPLLPGTEGLELFLHSHPSGSKSSLTSLHLPFHLSEAPPPGKKSLTPIITGVVSGESAQKILNKTPPPAPAAPVTPPKPRPQKPKASAATATLLRKGAVIRMRPPDCSLCKSHFRPVPELRGFICMCSPEITCCLKTLRMKRRDERLKSKLRKKQKLKALNQGLSKPRVPRPQPFHSSPSSSATNKSLSPLQKPLRASDHFLCEPRPSVSPGVWQVPPQPRPEVYTPSEGQSGAGAAAVGRLVIHLEDFYYGTAPGQEGLEQVRFSAVHRCLHCTKTLRSNVRLMRHMTDHLTDTSSAECLCPHCFRQFLSPYRLQRHLEAVHSAHSSSAVCQICELHFGSELSLLQHMKSTHKPGEMPYSCGVCGFRSSFFSQLWAHFEELHVDTKFFLCQFCLRVFKQSGSYQQHVARHQKKFVYSCDRCRLHFLFMKDRQEHQELLHKTYVRPAQLSGLRPGTRVTVRTYRVSPESQRGRTPGAALSKTEPREQEARKRRAVESLGHLLAHLDRSDLLPSPPGLCVECQSQVQDFRSHFPSRVQCSRCRFQTCCSRAYANHMIDNHSGNRKCPLYSSVFTSCPRASWGLECVTCGFSCDTGDAMAQHLCSSPEHTCMITETSAASSEDTWTDYLFPSTDEPDLDSDSEPQTGPVRSRGGFVSIDRLQDSSQVSITALSRPALLGSPAAMTITFRGPVPVPKPAAPLPSWRLSVLLHSLLHGVPAALRCFRVTPDMIGRWARLQRKQLANRSWRWDSGGGARWVLTEREQNRAVTEETLMDLSLRTLGPKTAYITRLNWAVDFLLRHDLGIETRSKELRDISYSVVSSTWTKVTSLPVPSARFCCLDEFPVFVAPRDLWALKPEALRVWGRAEERPLVEVLLCASSDGTLLRPMLFYCGDLPPLPRGFPTNVLLEARAQGFNLRERAQLWTTKVWQPHLGPGSSPSLLLLDEHCGHMTPDFLDPLGPSCTELVHVPQGCSCLVQPLDQCVTPMIRQFIQARWSQLVSQGPESISESDLVLTLGCWFSEVCHLLNNKKSFIQRSFVCVGARQKNVEVMHRMNQALYQALVQAPHLSSIGQSEALEQGEGAWLKTEGQSEALEQEEGAGLKTEGQSEALEQEEGAGLKTEGQSEALEQGAGLQPDGQSEALNLREEPEEAELQPEGQAERQETDLNRGRFLAETRTRTRL